MSDTASELQLAERLADVEERVRMLTTTTNALLGAVQSEGQPAELIATFIDSLDPEEIDRLTLDRLQWDEQGTSYTEMLLRVLRNAAGA